MIIVWGVNPSVSGIHIMPFLKEARDNGAFIVVESSIDLVARDTDDGLTGTERERRHRDTRPRPL